MVDKTNRVTATDPRRNVSYASVTGVSKDDRDRDVYEVEVGFAREGADLGEVVFLLMNKAAAKRLAQSILEAL